VDPVTHPALAYAESLGIHAVYDEALAFEAELDETLTALDKAQDERRSLDEQIDSREMDLLISERGKHPDHSEAAFSRHLKEVHHKDETLKMLKLKRNMKAGEVSGHELDKEFLKARIHVRASRLVSLGGYFEYLAAVKNAEPPPVLVQVAEQTTQPTQPGDTA